MSEDREVIAALIESNDILQEEVSRLRTSSRVLRTVIKALRASLASYRKQAETAKFNDDTFKAYCDGEFDTPVITDVNGGLPETSEVVEPVVATTEEASAPTAFS